MQVKITSKMFQVNYNSTIPPARANTTYICPDRGSNERSSQIGTIGTA